MNAKIVRTNSIVSAVMLLLYAGCGLLNLLLLLLTSNSMISLPSSVLLCLSVMLPTVVLLIFGIGQAKRKQGKADLIFSIITLLVSIAWLVLAVLNWLVTVFRNLIIEYYYRMDMAMSMADLISLLNYLNVAYMLLTTVVALYLLAVFVVRVLCAKQKWLQINAELHKPTVAVLILVPNLLSLVQTLLNPVFGRMGIAEMIRFTKIFSFASFGITTVLTLALAVFVLVFGLIIKKKTATEQQAPATEPQPEQSAPADLPFNVPAGVNPDDV